MKHAMRAALLFAAATAGIAATPAAFGQHGHSPRQYYGEWHKHPTQNYSYRAYYYKPSPTYAGYKHHYVVLTPARPRHQYFYNPYKKTYWGRCPVATNGMPQYSLLPPEHRKGSLADIPESAFPAPGELPAIPDATDDAKLELPPDDLPGDLGLQQ